MALTLMLRTDGIVRSSPTQVPEDVSTFGSKRSPYRMARHSRKRLHTLAEQLAAQGRFRDAIAIYELNADFYPRSAAIAGSLGRLYEQLADTAAAIRSFERTLELRPNNRQAAERLRALRGR